MRKFFRKTLSIVFVLFFLFSPITSSPVQAQAATEISSAAQLQGISMGGSYRLTADITLSSAWTPLGTEAAPFTGTLDGNGHTIRNLTVSNTQQSNQGLFGYIGPTGEVMNLRIENAYVTAADNAGILAGVNQGAISRVSVQGTITGANAVGGLVGTNSGLINDSYATAAVTGKDKNGGLVGSNSGTLTNTYAVGTVSKSLTNTYVGFDGEDDYVSIPHNAAYVTTGSYTLEAWFNWTVTDRQAVQFIVGKGLEEFEIHTGGFEPIKANGIRYIPINRMDDVLNQSGVAYNDAHNVLQPGWNHVAVIWDLINRQVRIYLNGIPQNIFQNNINMGTTATVPLNPAVTNPLAANEEDLYIGARNDQNAGVPGYYFQGNISDVRLWNRVRTPEEISADKNARLTGEETGLVGYWPLDETSGSTINDYSAYGNDGFLHTDPDGSFTEANATRVQVNGISGGLVGDNTSGTVVNGYYDSTVYGVTDPIPYGSPLITADMKKQTSFSGWDFDFTWDIVEGSSYPTLTNFDVTVNQASGQSDPSNANPVNFTVDFSKPINSSSFTSDDVSISAGTCTPSVEVTAIAPYDFTNFNIAVSGLSGNCTVSASIPAGKVQNPAGTIFNASTSTDNQVAFEGAVPNVTINQATDQADPTNTSPVYFTAVFSKPINPGTFTADDVTLSGEVGGLVTGITQIAPNDNTTFRIEVGNLTGEGFLTASILAGVVSDSVGNLNTAATTTDNMITLDTTAPTVIISSTVLDYSRYSPVDFIFTFSEAVTGFDTADITVVNGSATALSGSGTVYTASITPSSEGEVEVQLAAGMAADAAGNGNTVAVPESFIYDITRPSVTVNEASGQSDPTNIGPIYFTAVFSEPVDYPEIGPDVTVSDTTGAYVTDVSEAAPNDGTVYTITVDGMTANGDVSVSIPAGWMVDRANNKNTASTSTDNTVTFDSSAPTVEINLTLPIGDSATSMSPISVYIEFSEVVTGFEASDIVVGNGTVSDFVGFTTLYDISITPTTEGLVTISVPAGVAVDSSGNPNVASDTVSFTYDTTRPSVTVEQASSQSDPTNLVPIHFTAVFSESLDGMSLHPGCIQVSGTEAIGAIPMITEIAPFDQTAYDISLIGMFSDGTLSVSIQADCVYDAAWNSNFASTSVDNTVTYDTTHVSVVITSSEPDPTNASPIPLTFTFSKDVTGFVLGDISVENGTLENFSGSGSIYTAEITPAADGQVTVDVPADVVTDAAGNENDAADQFTIQYDSTAPSVTVNQASDQADPTNSTPIHFTAVFSKPIDPDTFTAEDVTLSGETGAEVAGIAEIEPNDGTTFDITVDSMTADGVVSVSILEDLVEDLAGNTNTASTSTDNAVSYETSGPGVPEISLKLKYTKNGPGSFTLTFSKPVYNPEDDTDPDDVTNPANFLLFERGANKLFDTVSCELGLADDDVQVPVASVTYDELTYTATVLLNESLPVGRYKLLVCGTTSIVDLAFNPLNGGIDLVYNITVSPESHDDDDAPIASTTLPNSGFAPGQITLLLPQSAEKAYYGTDLVLDIPTLGISATIVGVPNQDNSWDVSWLGNQAGYLYGSAYPTWAGNTVLTGHVWDADNTPGIFANIRNLRYGDRFHIHAFGKTYTYEVRESSIVSGGNVSGVFKSEELDWVTLLTCEGYRFDEDVYAYRRMVRAVLVEMK